MSAGPCNAIKSDVYALAAHDYMLQRIAEVKKVSLFVKVSQVPVSEQSVIQHHNARTSQCLAAPTAVSAQ